MIQKAELQVSNMLLNRGVAVQIKAPLLFRIFGKKKVKRVIKAPTIAVLLKIATIGLHFEINEKELTLKKASEYLAIYGDSLCEIIAIAIANSIPAIFRPFLKSRIKNSMSAIEIMQIYQLLMIYGGYEDFTSTIKFIKQTRITKPMNLSQKTKGS